MSSPTEVPEVPDPPAGGDSAGGEELHGSWPDWLRENLDRRCDPEELLGILLRHGFSAASIRQHMGASFPGDSSLLRQVPDPTAVDYGALARARITRLDGGFNAQQVLTDKLQLYLLDSFMTDAECARIARLAGRHLRPSTITTGARRDYRSSRTSDLGILGDPAVAAMDERIARTLGISLPYSESMQAQRYDVGEEFKPHTDFFDPGTTDHEIHARGSGQRTWTFMVYLNGGGGGGNELRGGGTKFHAIDMVIAPRRGLAVVWNNLFADGQPNPDTVHSGLPVERGHKIVVTKWFVDRGAGPMFL